jgi:AcrR family transcriptional regulator
MSTKLRRKPDEIRALILDAARERFAIGGYRGTSTREIAATARVSERLIYFHFTNKANLFEEAVAGPLAAFMETFAEDWRRYADRPHELQDVARRWIGGMFDLLRANRKLVLAMLTAGEYEHEIQDALSGKDSPIARIHQLTEEIMTSEALAGGYEGLDLRLTVRLPFAALLSAAVLDGPVFAGLGRRPSRDAIVDELTALMIYGTTSRPTSAPRIPRAATSRPDTPRPRLPRR